MVTIRETNSNIPENYENNINNANNVINNYNKCSINYKTSANSNKRKNEKYLTQLQPEDKLIKSNNNSIVFNNPFKNLTKSNNDVQ
jgi:hypothetical protein